MSAATPESYGDPVITDETLEPWDPPTVAGELEASDKLAQAAGVIATEPTAITLRYLQTLTEIAAEKNSTIIFPLPIEILHLLRQLTGVEPKGPTA